MRRKEKKEIKEDHGCGLKVKFMDKGIIYYTDNQIQEPIRSLVWKQMAKTGLPITASFLQPGEERSYPQMVRQIISCLESSVTKYVFFCEHDVLYHPSHFDFIPTRDDTYYYNLNNWRWDYPKDRLIGYEGLTSLSQMCANRELLLKHYRARLKKIEKQNLHKIKSKEPEWARTWGYEPGTKKRRNGGFSDELSERWRSEFPNIDIRHKQTFSPPKVTLSSFKHKPTGWTEMTLDKVEGWNLKELFNI